MLWSMGLQVVRQTEKLKETGAPVVKNLPIDAEDARSIPGSGRASGEENVNPF